MKRIVLTYCTVLLAVGIARSSGSNREGSGRDPNAEKTAPYLPAACRNMPGNQTPGTAPTPGETDRIRSRATAYTLDDEDLDTERMPAVCAGEQYPTAPEPQRLPLGTRRHERGQSGDAAVADRLNDPGIHELPLDERLRPQHLHRDLRHRRRADPLRGRQTPHGGQTAAGAEPDRQTVGRRGRKRHPHRHRTGLHAGTLCRGSRDGCRQYGRSIPGAARPCRGVVESRLDQPGRSRAARKPTRERSLPGHHGPDVARQLPAPAQTAAGARHNGGDEPCHACHPRE